MKKYSFSHNKTKRNKTPIIPKKNNNINKSESKKDIIPIIDLLKCPLCKNICLMNIDREKLLFSFECNSKHKVNLKKSKTYINSDNNLFSNISDVSYIITNSNNINKDNNTSNISGENESKKINETKKKYITENDFSCLKHPKSDYIYYCYECEENICDECNKNHLNHNKVALSKIKPNENEVINYKNEIKKEEDELNNIIEKMMKWKKEFEYGLNTIIKVMQNILNLRQFIIMNYDLKQSNQNYNYIQNFNNMKVLNVIFPELKEFLIQKKWKKKGYILIDSIVNIQEKIVQNREKLKVMKLKEEIDKKTEILKKQMEVQEKHLLKSKKNDKISEEHDNIDSIASTHSDKKNFNTTFSSDCMNNNYFCRNVSRRVVNMKNIKKKIIEKRNRNQNDNTLSHTIEQNKELEKDFNKENNNIINEENIKIKEKPNIDSEMKKVDSKVETNSNNNKSTENKEENQDINYININDNNIDNNGKVNTLYNVNNVDNGEKKEYSEENNHKIIIDENNYNTIEKNEELEKRPESQNHQSEKINSDNNENIKIEINHNNFDNIEEGEINNPQINENQNQIEMLRNKPKKIYNNIELKYELTNTDMIRSIEFTKNNHILICTLENLGIYKINQNYELEKLYDIKEYNYRMNYCSQLSNGNLVICSLNTIDIINILEDNDSISYTINQQLTGKNDSYNINKVIEIREKNYLISCDKNNIIIYSKNNETNLYNELNYINTKSEVKCLEQINEKIFVTVEPEEQCVIFYEIEDLQKNIIVNNIQSSFGRYAISYIPKNNCIYVTGRKGIYLISTNPFQKIKFFDADEWISSINYDSYNDYLICGTWNKDINDEKIYNLILYKVEGNELNLFDRKNDIHSHDIVVIKPSEEGYILTGSNDRTVKLWN